jgi:molybdate transport system substrate-binding protein
MRGIAGVLTAVVLLAGCGSGAQTRSTGGGRTGSPASTGTVTVFAAASLTESFSTLARQFEHANPGVTVRLDFGASSALALQIDQGAPADVFASASAKNMTQVIEAKAATSSRTFARNVLQIAVPPANPAAVTGVGDLARAGVKVALCQPQVPCGATAQKVFDKAKITVKPVTLEQDVKSVLTKVETDEVDAGLVYLTDVRAAGAKVRGIPIPDALNASTEYPIATLTAAAKPALAAAFVDYVLSGAGQDVLSAAGFGTP